MTDFINYILQEHNQILTLLLQHIQLTFLSVGTAILIGVPIGILISHFKKADKTVLGIANTIQAIPSMALLGFLIPFLGIGVVPSVFMVVLYSLLPIIKNTFTSIEGISPQMIEAAEGIGLTKLQILFKIQIPMALPIIMAGIRISAVTAVGLMTIAAFVGAGGLGFLVFSGIRTANTNQILAGAIPACFLALFIDWTAAIIEKLLVPKGLSKSNNKTKITLFQKFILIFTLLLIFFGLTKNYIKNFKAKSNKTITIGSKDYTEQIVLANILAELIENNTDLKVNRKLALGGTKVIFGALEKGDIDIYMEYTGTIFADMLKYNPIKENVNTQDVYKISKQDLEKKYNIIVGNELPFNNTYRLAIKKELANKYNITKISDLIPISSDLTISPTFEFTNKHDGLPGLKNKYNGLNFKDVVSIDGALRYQALANNESDVIDAFATDGMLSTYDLVLLEDDKNFFLPYHAVPLMKKHTLVKYPELKNITMPLETILTDDVMRDLNNKVDTLKQEPKDVAHQFLIEHNLIQNNQNGGN
ncbi:glycine betaine ABC transporter substrate-binding protein [Fusobacterium hominis]|uniref:ABC transporter permease/substrate-binding protein n=1 Tax=Fusobacterium hominis TaxID=2764326 RepID=UPI0022E68185|nr:glycine betaine ABC transporter substrate-binding protein [Fusobacterium hominis]